MRSQQESLNLVHVNANDQLHADMVESRIQKVQKSLNNQDNYPKWYPNNMAPKQATPT